MASKFEVLKLYYEPVGEQTANKKYPQLLSDLRSALTRKDWPEAIQIQEKYLKRKNSKMTSVDSKLIDVIYGPLYNEINRFILKKIDSAGLIHQNMKILIIEFQSLFYSDSVLRLDLKKDLFPKTPKLSFNNSFASSLWNYFLFGVANKIF